MSKSAAKQTEIGIESLMESIQSTNQSISEIARREALKTDHDIYTEVFIDEIN